MVCVNIQDLVYETDHRPAPDQGQTDERKPGNTFKVLFHMSTRKTVTTEHLVTFSLHFSVIKGLL